MRHWSSLSPLESLRDLLGVLVDVCLNPEGLHNDQVEIAEDSIIPLRHVSSRSQM